MTSENTTETTLSQADIVRAATNDPALTKDEFMLGDRKFPVVDLSYDDYLRFLTLLTPLLETVVGGVMAKSGFRSGAMLSPKDLISSLSDSLPELVSIVCNQTDETMTVEEVKLLGRTPFKLADIVMKQIEHNKIISEIASFFAQMLPVLKAALSLRG